MRQNALGFLPPALCDCAKLFAIGVLLYFPRFEAITPHDRAFHTSLNIHGLFSCFVVLLSFDIAPAVILVPPALAFASTWHPRPALSHSTTHHKALFWQRDYFAADFAISIAAFERFGAERHIFAYSDSQKR